MFFPAILSIPSDINLWPLLPALLLVTAGLFGFLSECLNPENTQRQSSLNLLLPIACFAGIGVLAYSIYTGATWSFHFNGMLMDNMVVRYASILILLVLASVDLLSVYEKGLWESNHPREFHMLLAFSGVGALLLPASNNLLLSFLALEIYSIALFVLIGFPIFQQKSQNASITYFFQSAFASAFFLMGLVLLFGATGTLSISEIVTSTNLGYTSAVIGAIFIVGAILFKLSIVPFHLWTPGVYAGAPFVVTLYMAIVTKVAFFSALAPWLWQVPDIVEQATSTNTMIASVIQLLGVASIVLGSLYCLKEKSLSRFIACSGIAQSGYLFILFLYRYNSESALTLTCYLTAYTFGTLAFATPALFWQDRLGLKEMKQSHIQGLAKDYPFLAIVFFMGLVSLAGFPVTLGFVAKFSLILNGAYLPIYCIFIILGSLLGGYFYLNMGLQPFLDADGEPQVEVQEEQDNTFVVYVLSGLFLMIILLGGLIPQVLFAPFF